uniref:FAM193_C domain-containing protein n=1 Tax=Caenorhabditis tropicalis TaxID=1561998 RepID=A0A1I7SZ02_9PELO
MNKSENSAHLHSVLRNYIGSFEKLFDALLPYCGTFYDELAELDDLKIQVASHVSEEKKEKQYFLNIELKYTNINKILPNDKCEMGSKLTKTDPAENLEVQHEKACDSSSTSVILFLQNPIMVTYILLKVIHVFVQTMNKSDDAERIHLILRDKSGSFDDFFKALLPYCGKLYEELAKLDDLKVQVGSQVLKGTTEKQYFLNIGLTQSPDDIVKISPPETTAVQTKSHSEDDSKEKSTEASKTSLPENSFDKIEPNPEGSGSEPETTHETSNAAPLNSSDDVELHSENISKVEITEDTSTTSISDSSENPSESFGNPDSVDSVDKEKSEEKSISSVDMEPLNSVEKIEESNQYLNDCIESLKKTKVSNSKEVPYDPDFSAVEELGKPLENAMQHQEAIKTDREDLASTQQFSAANELNEEEGYDTDKENREDFNEKLENQTREHKEELDRLRKQREEKNKQQQDELNEMRNQQKQRFAALIHCILLKKQFEKMENEWSGWIEMDYKKHVIRVINKFNNFLDETRNVKFERTSEDSLDNLKLEILSLDREVLALFYNLENIFNGLENVVSSFEDAMFPRVLQNSVCVIAAKLNNVWETLEEMDYSTEWMQRLEDAMSKIKPLDVPTVTNLRETCKNASMENFHLFTFPQRQSSKPIINEVDIDDTPDSNVEKVQEPMENKVAKIDLESIDFEHQKLQSAMERKAFMPPLEGSDEKNESHTTPETSNATTEVLNCGDELKNKKLRNASEGQQGTSVKTVVNFQTNIVLHRSGFVGKNLKVNPSF